MSNATIETFSGKWFDILEPTVDMIDIEDIAHALAQANRFTGHCRFPYPVAQHCRLASYLVAPQFELWTLLHDATEAYIGDMSRPLKHFTVAGKEYLKVEKRIQDVICQKFGLEPIEPAEVKKADTKMLLFEKRQLMSDLQWNTAKEKETSRMTQEQFDSVSNNSLTTDEMEIVETSFRENKQLFLDRFYELTNR